MLGQFLITAATIRYLPLNLRDKGVEITGAAALDQGTEALRVATLAVETERLVTMVLLGEAVLAPVAAG